MNLQKRRWKGHSNANIKYWSSVFSIWSLHAC